MSPRALLASALCSSARRPTKYDASSTSSTYSPDARRPFAPAAPRMRWRSRSWPAPISAGIVSMRLFPLGPITPLASLLPASSPNTIAPSVVIEFLRFFPIRIVQNACSEAKLSVLSGDYRASQSPSIHAAPTAGRATSHQHSRQATQHIKACAWPLKQGEQSALTVLVLV